MEPSKPGAQPASKLPCEDSYVRRQRCSTAAMLLSIMQGSAGPHRCCRAMVPTSWLTSGHGYGHVAWRVMKKSSRLNSVFLKIGAGSKRRSWGCCACRAAGAGTPANAPALGGGSQRSVAAVTPPHICRTVYWAGVYRPAAISTFWRALASRAFRRAAVLMCSTPLLTALSITAAGQGARRTQHGSEALCVAASRAWSAATQHQHQQACSQGNHVPRCRSCSACGGTVAMQLARSSGAAASSTEAVGCSPVRRTLVCVVDEGLHGGQVSLSGGRGGLERIESGQHLHGLAQRSICGGAGGCMATAAELRNFMAPPVHMHQLLPVLRRLSRPRRAAPVLPCCMPPSPCARLLPDPTLLTFFMRVATSLLRALLYMRACTQGQGAAAASEQVGLGGRLPRRRAAVLCSHCVGLQARAFRWRPPSAPSRPCAAASASSAWPPPRRPLLPRCAAAALRARSEGQGQNVRCRGRWPAPRALAATAPRPTTPPAPRTCHKLLPAHGAAAAQLGGLQPQRAEGAAQGGRHVAAQPRSSQMCEREGLGRATGTLGRRRAPL